MVIDIGAYRKIANQANNLFVRRVTVNSVNPAPKSFFGKIVSLFKGRKTDRNLENRLSRELFRSVLKNFYGKSRAIDPVFPAKMPSEQDESKNLTNREVKKVLSRMDELVKFDEMCIRNATLSTDQSENLDTIANRIKNDLGAGKLMDKHGLSDLDAVCINFCARKNTQVDDTHNNTRKPDANSAYSQERINKALANPNSDRLVLPLIRQARVGLDKLPSHNETIYMIVGESEAQEASAYLIGKQNEIQGFRTITDDKLGHRSIYQGNSTLDEKFNEQIGDKTVFAFTPQGSVCKEVSKFVGGDQKLYLFQPDAVTLCTNIRINNFGGKVVEIDVFMNPKLS